MSLNLLLVFLMIFVANKTREIEKNNNNLKLEISKINENLKINEIEFTFHKNTSYLKKLYSLYFNETNSNKLPQVISFKQLSKDEKIINLVKIRD